jgi:hypothetical protein
MEPIFWSQLKCLKTAERSIFGQNTLKPEDASTEVFMVLEEF